MPELSGGPSVHQQSSLSYNHASTDRKMGHSQSLPSTMGPSASLFASSSQHSVAYVVVLNVARTP